MENEQFNCEMDWEIGQVPWDELEEEAPAPTVWTAERAERILGHRYNRAKKPYFMVKYQGIIGQRSPVLAEQLLPEAKHILGQYLLGLTSKARSLLVDREPSLLTTLEQ